MPCALPSDSIERTIAFHGHSCPGLAIGMRAAELALTRLGHNDQAELVAVVETDMCGVDAIQFLTGCTLGKGNLIHKDLGKMAFSFYSRKTGEGFRALLDPTVREDLQDKLTAVNRRLARGTATDEDQEMSQSLRRKMQERLMQADLEEVFQVIRLASDPPRPARVLESLTCESCGERTMESRTCRFAGRTLCIPCFEDVEQKV